MNTKHKILVIENEPNRDRRSIDKLKKEFAHVKIVKGAGAAKNILSHNTNFDVIILDIMMEPDGYTLEETESGLETGFTLYKELIEDIEDTIVIVWSGYYNYRNLDWGDNVKVKIEKDIDENILVNEVLNILK